MLNQEKIIALKERYEKTIKDNKTKIHYCIPTTWNELEHLKNEVSFLEKIVQDLEELLR